MDRVELDADEVVLDRTLTIPNGISVLRLVVVAAALVVLFHDGDCVAAAVLLAVAGATDFLDGYVARRIGQVSRLGKILDPTIDRMVLASSIIAILVYGALPWWIAAVGAVVATAAEKFTPRSRGIWDDNWTITLSSLLVMTLLYTYAR